jgi:RimJ/RimL family protein N-acetyltransferase
MVHARETLGLGRLLAITSQDNTASIGLLDKLGFTFERMLETSDDEPEVRVFVSEPRPQDSQPHEANKDEGRKP